MTDRRWQERFDLGPVTGVVVVDMFLTKLHLKYNFNMKIYLNSNEFGKMLLGLGLFLKQTYLVMTRYNKEIKDRINSLI